MLQRRHNFASLSHAEESSFDAPPLADSAVLSSTKATVNSSLDTPTSSDFGGWGGGASSVEVFEEEVDGTIEPLDESEREGHTFQQKGIVQYIDVTFNPGLVS
jgi:hypothetical protein